MWVKGDIRQALKSNINKNFKGLSYNFKKPNANVTYSMT